MWNQRQDSDCEDIPIPNYSDLKQDLEDCAIIVEDEDGSPASKLKDNKGGTPAYTIPSSPIAEEDRSQREDDEDNVNSEVKAPEDEDACYSSEELSVTEASQAPAEEPMEEQNDQQEGNDDAVSLCSQDTIDHVGSSEKAPNDDVQSGSGDMNSLITYHEAINTWQKSLFMREIHNLFDLSQQLVQHPLSKKERELIGRKLNSGFGDLLGIIRKPKKLGRGKSNGSAGKEMKWKIDQADHVRGADEPFKIKIRKLKPLESSNGPLLDEVRAAPENEQRCKEKSPVVKSKRKSPERKKSDSLPKSVNVMSLTGCENIEVESNSRTHTNDAGRSTMEQGMPPPFSGRGPPLSSKYLERPQVTGVTSVEQPCAPTAATSRRVPWADKCEKSDRNLKSYPSVSVSLVPPLSMLSSTSTQTDDSWERMVARVGALEDLYGRLESESERVRSILNRMKAQRDPRPVRPRGVHVRCPACPREKPPNAWACSSCQTFFVKLSNLYKSGVDLPDCNHQGTRVMKCNGCRRFQLQNSWLKKFPKRGCPLPKV